MFLRNYVILFSLFFYVEHSIFFLLGTRVIHTVYRGLHQGSYLSPILFDVYISSVSNNLSKNEFGILFYADDIIVYSKAKSIDKSINNLNSVLDVLSMSLSFVSLKTAPD